MKYLLAFILALCLGACGQSGPGYKVVTLPSGHEIRVIAVGRMYFTQAEPALQLSYQTQIGLDDHAALLKEVDEIWPVFRSDVERAQLQTALISANEVPSGFILTTNRGYTFVFQKASNGEWVRKTQ